MWETHVRVAARARWRILARLLQGAGKSVLEAVAANRAGRNVTVHCRKVVIGGISCAPAGPVVTILVVQLLAYAGISVRWLLFSHAFVDACHGTVISPNHTLTLSEIPLQQADSAGAIMQTGQRIGTIAAHIGPGDRISPSNDRARQICEHPPRGMQRHAL